STPDESHRLKAALPPLSAEFPHRGVPPGRRSPFLPNPAAGPADTDPSPQRPSHFQFAASLLRHRLRRHSGSHPGPNRNSTGTRLQPERPVLLVVPRKPFSARMLAELRVLRIAGAQADSSQPRVWEWLRSIIEQR